MTDFSLDLYDLVKTLEKENRLDLVKKSTLDWYQIVTKQAKDLEQRKKAEAEKQKKKEQVYQETLKQLSIEEQLALGLAKKMPRKR